MLKCNTDVRYVTRLVSRLVTSILPSAKAKTVLVDHYFRVPKRPKAPDGVPRYILLCFQTILSKLAVQAATHASNKHQFEGADFSFYNDLCRSTLQWIQSMRLVTQP
ncbi:Hypothetical predicted protein [Pelobates cultripes]|uniref:Uncharacterized protein n=1 Tax=Pelobates cultripes TaxID=61616 RepID=A0AAD1RYE6_PELCU|nr:Hypothetical predicted protein [Pelobates cultripes]